MKSIKMRGVVAAVAGALMFGFGANAMADSTDDILNALIAKGVLTEEEGALLMKGREGEKAGNAKKVKVTDKNGSFTLETGDGKNTMALTGRVHFDMRSVNGSDKNNNDGGVSKAFGSDGDTASTADQFELRRARIGVKGKMFEHYDYEVIANAVGGNTNIVDVAYVNAGMFQQAQLKLGQFKQPFNLEEYGTSSNNIDFMERSYINQITPGKKVGAMVHGILPKGFTYAGSVFQQNNFGETDADSDGKGFAGRVTANIADLAGWNTKETVLHVGVAGFDQEYGVVPTTTGNTANPTETLTRGTVFSFRTEGRGLTNLFRAQISGDVLPNSSQYGARSNTSATVDNKAYGLELAAAYGPVKFQGEYMGSKFDATHANTNTFLKADVNTFYVEALWMLTGENYAEWYKNGAWSGIKPKNNFDVETGKGRGAWEVGFRYSEFEVDNVSGTSGESRVQGAVTGSAGQTSDSNAVKGATLGSATGGAKTYTAGIKWQLNPSMRVLLNYSRTDFDNAFKPIDVSANGSGATKGSNGSVSYLDHEDLVMLRTQIAF